MKQFLSILLSLTTLFALHGQKKNTDFQYHIHRTTSEIVIDGLENDAAWQEAQLATNFHQVLPMDTGMAKVVTEVRMLYDDQNLYLLAVNYDKEEGPFMVESLRRDFSFGNNDNFLLFLDPFDDQTNGFTFGANAAGAQWDGLLFEGGSADLSWDNIWYSEVKSTDDKWVFEMAVPFKTLRYKKGITEWGINFSRLDLKAAEKSAWAPVPRQFPTASLAYTGVLVWDEAPPVVRSKVTLIPYTLGRVGKDHEADSDTEFSGDIGGDAKIALTSSLNLDLTINPDFSQVEVDVQQTNLDRFELFFPERRQFFIENGDLFANFGYETVRPFFSRRIGLNAPIHFGARLSGKLNKDWRIGAMNMQTGKSYNEELPGQNFSVLAIQRRVFSRSNISAIFVNQETPKFDEVDDVDGLTRFNRNVGFEYNLASSNNIWTGKLLYLKSFSPKAHQSGQIIGGNLAYNAKHFNFDIRLEHIGDGFRAETGFVPRTGFNHLLPALGYLFFPKSSPILSHGPFTKLEFFFDEKMRHFENELFLLYNFNFQNRSNFGIWVSNNYVELSNPFDPTNFVGEQIAADTDHQWNAFGTEFRSTRQSLLTWGFNSRYGGYYADGTRLNLGGEIGYRFQPFVAFNIAANYNQINFGQDDRLPEVMKNQRYNLWLVGPRLDVTFTNKLFFTNFIQYNDQTENINLNLRMQWRFRPASDLFIVYTNNYYSDFSQVRNQALVVKLRYWWNL